MQMEISVGSSKCWRQHELLEHMFDGSWLLKMVWSSHASRTLFFLRPNKLAAWSEKIWENLVFDVQLNLWPQERVVAYCSWGFVGSRAEKWWKLTMPEIIWMTKSMVSRFFAMHVSTYYHPRQVLRGHLTRADLGMNMGLVLSASSQGSEKKDENCMQTIDIWQQTKILQVIVLATAFASEAWFDIFRFCSISDLGWVSQGHQKETCTRSPFLGTKKERWFPSSPCDDLWRCPPIWHPI